MPRVDAKEELRNNDGVNEAKHCRTINRMFPQGTIRDIGDEFQIAYLRLTASLAQQGGQVAINQVANTINGQVGGRVVSKVVRI